jgi:hypothetical protein
VVRFCDQCQETVHNLDAMSSVEIRALLAVNPHGFCGTFVGGDGRFTVPAQDPRPGISGQKRAGLAATVIAAALVGCSDPTERTPTSPTGAETQSLPTGPAALVAEQSRSESSVADELTEQQLEALRSLGYVIAE